MGWKVNHKRIKQPVGRNQPYLDWLKAQPCFLEGMGCGGDVSPCHVPDPASNGMGKKVDDQWAIPMCYIHHRVQHDKGWDTFAEMFRFLPRMIATQFFARFNAK